MDTELFQEKMDSTHRMYLCRMLNVKNLPEDLLERYAQVKSLVDRIDGHLTPGDLAMIIVSAKGRPISIGEKALAEAVAIDVAGKVGSLDESDDMVIEEAIDEGKIHASEIKNAGAITSSELEVSQVSGATGQAADKPAPEQGKAMLWAPGMPVNVFRDDEIKQGKIVGISPPSDVGKQVGSAVKLTVEFEGGETETFDEDECEAE